MCVCFPHMIAYEEKKLNVLRVYYSCRRVMNGVHMSWELSAPRAGPLCSRSFSSLSEEKAGGKKKAKHEDSERVGEVERW